MPIKKRVDVSEFVSWAIWEITESFEELCAFRPLDRHDLEWLDHIRHEKKRLEYLAGRLAVQYLLDLRGLDFQGIYKDEWGKPNLVNNIGHISISNTYPYAVGMFNQFKPSGIDMEKGNDKTLRIAHKFLNQEEIISANSELAALNILWCAKEALYKMSGKRRLSFKSDIEIDSFSPGSSGFLTGRVKAESTGEYSLHYIQWEGYTICYTV